MSDARNSLPRLAHAVLATLFALTILVSVGAAQSAPEVTKVEPPNWWAGHSINPVRVLLRGRNLAGARVEAVGGAGLRASNVRVNAAGTYLFADVSITPQARP